MQKEAVIFINIMYIHNIKAINKAFYFLRQLKNCIMNNFEISYANATVMHANKYNQNTGILIYFFIFSNLLQDVVFKMEEDGREFSTTFKNLNLALYPGQKVKLVAINTYVIAYIDQTTNQFYYLSNNLQHDLKYGFVINWRMIFFLSMLSIIISAFIFTNENRVPLITLSLLLGLYIYQRITTYLLEKKIDKLIAA